eukprot:scaffold1734_cov113-Isochrysis_galbana.AAC.23
MSERTRDWAIGCGCARGHAPVAPLRNGARASMAMQEGEPLYGCTERLRSAPPGRPLARGAQPVAVEAGADVPAIGEGHHRGAIPWLHQVGVVRVKGLAGWRARLALPRLRYHHHHSLVEGSVARAQQELGDRVEVARVGELVRADGPQLREVLAKVGRLQQRLARAHHILVAAQRVDLAIVTERPEWLGPRPRWEATRRKSLRGRPRRRGSRWRQQAVAGRARGPAPPRAASCPRPRPPATSRGAARIRVRTPADQAEANAVNVLLDNRLALGDGLGVAREEDVARAVLPERRQRDAHLRLHGPR